jgi:hypothetical protein
MPTATALSLVSTGNSYSATYGYAPNNNRLTCARLIA